MSARQDKRIDGKCTVNGSNTESKRADIRSRWKVVPWGRLGSAGHPFSQYLERHLKLKLALVAIHDAACKHTALWIDEYRADVYNHNHNHIYVRQFVWN